MRDTLVHRGPDDAGEWWSGEGRVGLGHRRLAIIDLSPAGHQPMSDADARVTVTFNGEIYNYRELRAELQGRGHRFRSASDTEVLLEAYRAWGDAFLARLNGMFAFALYDRERERLLLARDRAGEKPLFYRQAGATLLFASELKALMADPSLPRRIDVGALEHYLAYGYVPDEMCILAGVRKLPPAHALAYELSGGRLTRWRYWDLPEPDPAGRSEAELLAELEGLLLDSVRLRLVADVPVGIMLSGGIDSGLVAAMAVRAGGDKVRTFTVCFPGRPGYDESPQARAVARHLGTEHAEIVAEGVTVDLLDELVRQYDEPIADASMIPTALVSRAIRAHAKVALAGDGGDELFGGYPHYRWLLWQDRLRRALPGSLRRWVRREVRRLPLGLPGRNHVIALGGDEADGIAHVNLYFDAGFRRDLLVPPLPAGEKEPEDRRRSACRPGWSRLQQATRADFGTTLPDGYLVKVDRASMLSSLEVRAPFLDHRLVEMAFSRVPDHLRANGVQGKILTRRLAERLLPPGAHALPKRGFGVPLAAWYEGAWGKRIRQVLAEADPTLFARPAIEGLLAGQGRGLHNAYRLFALTIFELWRREYRATL